MHGKRLDQSRDKALNELNRTQVILVVTEMASKIYKIEYKSGLHELVEVEVRPKEKAVRGWQVEVLQSRKGGGNMIFRQVLGDFPQHRK